MARIAIAFVYRDIFINDIFDKREIMIKHISATSGGWGLLGLEITPEIEAEGIESSLKQAIEAEMVEMHIAELPIFAKEIEHEGKRVLIYWAKFVGRPQRDMSNPDDSAIFADLRPYKLTDLATKVIQHEPKKPKKLKQSHLKIRATAY